MTHELVLLANRVDWSYLENEFSGLYSDTCQPGMPIRLMVGCLMLKRIHNIDDEILAEAWIRYPYLQYFCGEAHFQHKFPCDPSDFVHFRKRIGEQGIEKIFGYSVQIHGKGAMSKQSVSVTTVQGNNTSFPTDAKLAKKVIDKSNAIAQREGIEQRQTYKRLSKQLVRDTLNGKHPRGRKKAEKAKRKLRTLAGRQIRELVRKLSKESLEKYHEQMGLFRRAINQQTFDKDKLYSIHKPFTACFAKGKAHKPYEFGNKIGLVMNPKNLLILGIKAFEGNPHDNQTIEPLLEQMQKNLGCQPEEVVYDRGGSGKAKIGQTVISTPKPLMKADNSYQRRKKRKKFRRRAAIEPAIGHLKSQFRMEQNYLLGNSFPKINAMLAATGWNLKKLMEKPKNELKSFFQFPLQCLNDKIYQLILSW
ncbi:MAG: IS5 family transposase [Bacteroidales bacterium]|nr:IS5 family transposase [Bacteroidales bacterium]